MKLPQVINLNEDSVISIDGDNVIDDTDQLPLGTDHSVTSITAAVDFWDLISNSHIGPIASTMTYQSDVDIWTMDVSDFTSLEDRHKYVAQVTGDNNMRPFKINEFTVDNDSFEDTWMRLPYQVEVSGGEAWIRWYDEVANFGDIAHRKFEAAAYEMGVGTTYASDPSRVTHRGPIIPYVAP